MGQEDDGKKYASRRDQSSALVARRAKDSRWQDSRGCEERGHDKVTGKCEAAIDVTDTEGEEGKKDTTRMKKI